MALFQRYKFGALEFEQCYDPGLIYVKFSPLWAHDIFLCFLDFHMSNITNVKDFLIKRASLFQAFLFIVHRFAFPSRWERDVIIRAEIRNETKEIVPGSL